MANMNNIILTCIVRNESKTIKRMLDSCIHLVDMVCLCDTGSDDDTVEIVEEYKKEKSANINIFKQDWKNFGENRTLSFATAKECAENEGYDLNNSYALFLDADMVLRMPDFDKNSLENECYYLTQMQNNLKYNNIRFAKMSKDWECRGKTHELWRFEGLATEDCTYLSESSIFIDDINDGGHKSDKFERDENFLKEELGEKPNDPRSLFYLARTLRARDKQDEAIQTYLKHLEHSHSEGESYISNKDLMEIYLKKDDIGNAFNHFKNCNDLSPERCEHFYLISLYFRNKDDHNTSQMFLSSCPKFSEGNFLFLEKTMEYQIPFEKSISYYYSDNKKEGLENCDYCYINYPEIRGDASQNLIFYLNKLPYLKNEIDLEFKNDLNYTNSNCSLRKTKDGYSGYLKSSNYKVSESESDTIFTTLNGVPVRSKIYRINLNEDFKITSQSLIYYNEILCSRINGIEDCRETELGKVIGVRHDKSCSAKMVSFDVDKKGSIQNLEQLPSYQSHEKNWVPIDNGVPFLGDEYLVYSISPLRIVDQKGKTVLEKKNVLHESIRCSSNFVKISIDGELGFLGLTHEVLYVEGGKRQYLFRFVFYNETFDFSKISIPFLLEDCKIQFNLSLIKNSTDPYLENDYLIIPYSTNENKTTIARLNIQDLNKIWNTLM